MEKKPTNIIRFPRQPGAIVQNLDRLTKEQADEHINLLRDYIIENVLETVVPTIYNNMAMAGFPVTKDTAKDAALITEVLRSLMLKFYNIDHPFQTLADGMFTIDENEDLTLTGNLSIMTNTAPIAVGNN